MCESHLPLPSFDAPPVVETVVGVHFEQLSRFDVAQRSLFWSRLRDTFPILEEKVPLEEIREEFGEERFASGAPIRWQLSEAPPSPRLWAKSNDGRHTMQIQQDALLVNWERDPRSLSPYWPYDKRRRDLFDKLAVLDSFLRESDIGELRPTSCFARYINHIEYDQAAEFPEVLGRLLTTWCNQTTDDWLPPVEQASLHLTFPFPEQRGRLHVDVSPGARRKDNQRVLRMNFTARGVPSEATIEATLNWVDLGHEWIVRGFTSLTRPEMHTVWSRTQ